MKIVSWNVNSLNVRLPHLLKWLENFSPDIVCLQELKLEDHKFPKAEIEAAGYFATFSGQKTYNGVAILSKRPLSNIVIGNPIFPDEQKRLITASIDNLRVTCAYMPNGQDLSSDKYQYKLNWLAALKEWLSQEIAEHPEYCLCGDYNIAPEDRDVHDPARWAGNILCSPPERKAFQEIVDLGFVDSFRLFDQPDKIFSWWDYRMLGFQKNLGLRIDHILLSSSLAHQCLAAGVDREPRKWERPSDHAPVWAEVTLS